VCVCVCVCLVWCVGGYLLKTLKMLGKKVLSDLSLNLFDMKIKEKF
jgi:hypothetical protein